MANTVEKVLAIASAEVGYLEKSKAAYMKDKSVLDRKTDGAGYDEYTKYGRDMHAVYPAVMDFPAYWCDCFVDWCFYKAYGVATAKSLLGGNFNDYTVASAQMYMNKNAWHTKNPKPGDQIFFKNSTRICHTGIVEKVDATRVYTIEGNTSSGAGVVPNGGCVARKSYLLTNPSIAGYGRPKYDTETTESVKPSTTPSTPKKKTNEEIANEVLQGKWGNAPERKAKIEAAGYNYSAIQTIVARKIKNPTPVYVKKYKGTSGSITIALTEVGVDSSFAYRKKLAEKNGIKNYSGTAKQNTKLVSLLKQGKLIKA